MSEEKCESCGHDMKHHTTSGCIGSFPNGVKGYSEDEVFYGECHCYIHLERLRKEARNEV